MAREAPIYIHTHDLLDWLVNHLESWPRTQRFFLAQEVLKAASTFYCLLLKARKVPREKRSKVLRKADVRLEQLKAYLRLGHERGYTSTGQYRHVSGMTSEIGQELGGWLRTLQAS